MENFHLTLPEAGASKHADALRGVYNIDRVLQKAIFGEVLLVSPVQLAGGPLVLKAVSKFLAKQNICKNGSKVFENHGVELFILEKVRDLPHPHLLALAPDKYQFETGETRYTALPFLEGGELFGAVDANGSLGEEVSQSICRKIASALDHLHSALGFAHNDVSLENVLLSRDGSPVLCDYGLAKRIGAPWDAKRSISGKLPYQAPEIYFGTATESSGQADVFSLGVTLFVLLCGIPPFDLPDPAADQRYRYIQMGRMQALLDLWQKKSVPAGAVDLMTKMLAHDPSERISIAQVLLHPWIQSGARADDARAAASVEVDDCAEMEMDFGGTKADKDEGAAASLGFKDEDEEMPDAAPGKPTEPRSYDTPARRNRPSRIAQKSSPDSVFSFEAAYREHAHRSV